MSARYRFNPEQSRLTLQTFATGLLSFMSHNPTVAIRDFEGDVVFEDDMIAMMKLNLKMKAGSLSVGDAMKTSDRVEIESHRGRDHLKTAAFPEISYQAEAATSERIDGGHYRLGLNGTLMVRALSKPHQIGVDLKVFANGIRVTGETTLRQTEFGIQPVTALGGSFRLKDEVVLSFDLNARLEKS